MEIKELIGNTPMIKLYYMINGEEKFVYAKLEYYNLTGSIKDRIAYRIITKAQNENVLKKGMPIVEATSGNTGISVAALGAKFNHPVYIFMPDWVSVERKKIMQGYGANVILTSKEDGGFIRCVEEAKKFADEHNGFLINQFSNEENINAHFETTGTEILMQIPEKIDAFVSGVGTGGTLMGVGKKIKSIYSDSKIVAIEPEKMPVLSGGEVFANHKIEGIGDDFVPDLVDKKSIDDIILINDDDAINMARRLSRELGIGVGISSGANLIGAILLKEKGNDIVVTAFVDDNKKYLSTDLSKEIDENKTFVSNKIKLVKYESV